MLVKLKQYLESKLKDKLLSSEIAHNELNITVNPDDIVDILFFLKMDAECKFISFIDLSGVDFPEREDRFQVSYHLLSPTLNQRIRVKVFTKEGSYVPSVCRVFAGAEWYEREAYDMYGIIFKGNPDLRRILTDYGFEGHPLRKDYPVTGFVECRYDDELKKIVYEPVTLKQEMRNFDFLSPWEGCSHPYGTALDKSENETVG